MAILEALEMHLGLDQMHPMEEPSIMFQTELDPHLLLISPWYKLLIH